MSPVVTERLRLPLIGAPLFIISNPALVIEQCKAGIIGAFPALNARSSAQLDEWLHEIRAALGVHDRQRPEQPAAPFAVNVIVHASNDRLDADLAVIVAHRVPIVITSLGARADVNVTVHAAGGIVLHDVINLNFAHKAIDKGADGLIAVAAGAGGHAGTLSPFALVQEIRRWFTGPLALAGSIATGRAILAAQAMGADLAYAGSAFIATHEAGASAAYKAALLAAAAGDIVYTDYFTGVHGNYLAASIIAAGLDPRALPTRDATRPDFSGAAATAWRDIWGSGQGIGVIDELATVASLIARLRAEYACARADLAALAASYR
jgi:nitronate monooxygenase